VTLLHGSALVAGEGVVGVSGNPIHDRKLCAVPFKHHAEYGHHIPRAAVSGDELAGVWRGVEATGSLTVWFTDEVIAAWGGVEPRTTPDATLSRRTETLEAPLRRRLRTSPLHLLVDSTGLKLDGAGEWLVEKHGTAPILA